MVETVGKRKIERVYIIGSGRPLSILGCRNVLRRDYINV
jgi:hypothetical protein